MHSTSYPLPQSVGGGSLQSLDDFFVRLSVCPLEEGWCHRVASSPGHSQFFNVTHSKKGGPGMQAHMSNISPGVAWGRGYHKVVYLIPYVYRANT